jgi:hypothetical protein
MRPLLIAALALCGCRKGNDKDCIPVLLTVKNAGVQVTVKHGTAAPVDMGTAPLARASGVCAGDTVVLADGQRVYEESIQFAEPMEEKVIAFR